VKGNFLSTRSFRDLADLNAQAREWVLKEAGLRIYGTTRVRPLDTFAVERSTLLALPEVPPDLGTWHAVTVHRGCHVSFERALYSVPVALVGKALWLRATDAVVTVRERVAKRRGITVRRIISHAEEYPVLIRPSCEEEHQRGLRGTQGKGGRRPLVRGFEGGAKGAQQAPSTDLD